MAINDVVRHVILRILVDQAGLAEELAAAREKLKALKNSERDINKERGKSADEVTGKLKEQNKALGENSAAHEANRRARTTGQDRAGQVRAETDAIKQETQATDAQTLAEARAEKIRRETRQVELNEQQKRSDRRKRNTQDLEQAEAAAEQKRQDAQRQAFQRREQAGEQHEQKLANTQSKYQDQREQSKKAADQKLAESAQRSAQEEANRQRDAERRDAQSTQNFVNNEDRKRTAAAETERRRNEESQARVETSQARTFGVDQKNADASSILDSTREVREKAVTDKATSQSAVSQANASAAQSREAAAATREETAEEQRLTAETTRQNRALSEQETLRQRRIATTRQVRDLENDVTKASRQGELLEQRIAAAAEARARAAERETTAKRRQQTVLGSIGSAVSDVAVAGLRSVVSAPRASGRRAATTRDNTSDLQDIERKAVTVSGRVEKLFGDLGKRISRSVGVGAEDAASTLGKLTQRVRGYIESINRPRAGGSGKSLFSDLLGNLQSLGNKLSSTLSNGTRHLVSFQSLIIAVIAALGPLAAILGAVGAAALALASDIGALAGAMFALPGLISAAVSGFGALAIVMKPLTSIFSAYSQAQTAATKTTNAAKDAANDYKIALINQQQAYIDYKRAQADAPRAELALKDARKDATRQLEDYTTALKKLRFEQEGASLDVQSAEQQARRAMADPTASSLDRREALHNVQGALFDQQDQATNAKRTREDASEAFAKGVEGSDAVIAANRDVEDSARKIDLAYLQWQKDIIATQKAATAKAAGGDAAVAYKAQIDKLPPATKKVTLAILDLIKPDGPFQKMRNQLSEDIFGPLSKDTSKFKDLLDELQTFLEPAASAIGVLAKNAIDLFTNPAWKKFFEAQGEKNGDIIAKLGGAALDAANGFKAIIEVARPFTDFVVDGIASMAKSFGAFADSKKGRDDLAWFLQITQKRMTELWPVLKNVASGIGGFFKALNQPAGGKDDFTTWFNKGLLKASATFKDLGQKAQDPNGGFQKWLKDVKPLLHDVVGFISAAAGFAGRLFSDNRNINEARAILKEISSQWLPQLSEIFGKLSESGLVSKLATAIGDVFKGLNDFFDHGGLSTLSVFASTLEIAGEGFKTVAGWVDKLTQMFPALDGVLKIVGSTLALVFGAALVSKISGLTGLVTNLVKATGGIRNIARSVADPDPNATPGKSRFTRLRQNTVDAVKDTILPRDRGVSAARRRTRERADLTGGAGTGTSTGGRRGTAVTTPKVDLTGTGGVLPHLTRMEILLQRIAANTARYGGGGGSGGGSSSAGRGNRPRPGGGGGTSGGRPTGAVNTPDDPYNRVSNRKSRTTPWLERPTSALDRVETGRAAVPEGIDPNSKEGRAIRQAAVDRNRDSQRVIRDSGGATPIGLSERRAAQKIRTGESEFSYVRPEAEYTASPSVDPDTYKPPKAGSKRQTIPGLQDAYTAPLPAQRRDERGRIMPREPLEDNTGFRPYTNIAGAPTASRATRRKGRLGRLGKGLLGGLGAVGSALASPFTSGNDEGALGTGSLLSRGRGVADEFDEGYDEGYDDALNQLGGGQQQNNLPDRDKAGKKGKKGSRPGSREEESRRPGSRSRSRGRSAVSAVEDELEQTSRGRAGRRGLSAVEDGVEDVARSGGKSGGMLSRLVNRGGRSTVAHVAEEGIEDVAKVGGRSLLRGAAGGLLRGAAGGVGGLVAGAAATLGGDYLINKYVKNDKDAGSLQRGLGAVANGAGIGATIGSIIPGVGTVVGGAIGGLAGGAYSLLKDKNLRNFVGGKISSGAKKVGGFFKNIWDGGDDDQDVQPGHGAGQVGGDKPGGIKGLLSSAGSTIKDLAGGKNAGVGGALALATGPLGLLASKTDIGKMIITSLNKAGSAVGRFFTKTIPDFFHKGVQGIVNFFTKTLPSLPGKAFDFFFVSLGRLIRFFTVTLPAAAVELFTVKIPGAAKAAWGFVVNYLWNPFINFIRSIPDFFTKTIPHWFESVEKWREEHIAKPLRNFITKTIPEFFTVTIPKWFSEVPHWFKTHVIDNVTEFFTKTIPNFFTVDLPNAIKTLPGVLYDHLVQPILDFFKGLKGHIGDFLKGSWSWAKGLFSRADADIDKGEQGKMSGGLITGVYQGVEDTVRLRATPEEFVMRRSKVMEPGAKAILTDWNEGRINVSDFYKGLSANTAPAVMAMVPPEANQLTNRVATVVNHTTNHAPVMGDVTINNPIRERSEATLRRQIHIAAIRHRR